MQQEWFADRERMARAGFGDDHAVATKPRPDRREEQVQVPLPAPLPASLCGQYGVPKPWYHHLRQHGIGRREIEKNAEIGLR